MKRKSAAFSFAFNAFGALAAFLWRKFAFLAFAFAAPAAFALAIGARGAARANRRAVVFVVAGGYACRVLAPIGWPNQGDVSSDKTSSFLWRSNEMSLAFGLFSAVGGA